MTRFLGKSVLVTGAASGIGNATMKLFAREGARVLAVDIGTEFEAIAAAIPGVDTIRADVGLSIGVQAMIDRAIERHGGLDILVANAGVSGGMADLFKQTEEDWFSILQTNLVGPFLAIKAAGRYMLDHNVAGSIVCPASVAGLRAGAGGPAYSASKAGVINLVQMAAQTFTGTGIRVNAVCPGLIETEMTRFIYDGAKARGKDAEIGRLNPLQRGGHPDEIAEAIAFLASDASSYVNGQALVVDGGLSSSHPVPRLPQPPSPR